MYFKQQKIEQWMRICPEQGTHWSLQAGVPLNTMIKGLIDLLTPSPGKWTRQMTAWSFYLRVSFFIDLILAYFSINLLLYIICEGHYSSLIFVIIPVRVHSIESFQVKYAGGQWRRAFRLFCWAIISVENWTAEQIKLNKYIIHIHLSSE